MGCIPVLLFLFLQKNPHWIRTRVLRTGFHHASAGCPFVRQSVYSGTVHNSLRELRNKTKQQQQQQKKTNKKQQKTTKNKQNKNNFSLIMEKEKKNEFKKNNKKSY